MRNDYSALFAAALFSTTLIFSPIFFGVNLYLPTFCLVLFALVFAYLKASRELLQLLGLKIIAIGYTLFVLIGGGHVVDLTAFVACLYSMMTTIIAFALAKLFFSKPKFTTLIFGAMLLANTLLSVIVLGGIVSVDLINAVFSTVSIYDSEDSVARSSGIAGVAGAALSLTYLQAAFVYEWSVRKFSNEPSMRRKVVFHALVFISCMLGSFLSGRSGFLVLILLPVWFFIFKNFRATIVHVMGVGLGLSVTFLGLAVAFGGVDVESLNFIQRLSEVSDISEKYNDGESNSFGGVYSAYQTYSFSPMLIGTGDFGRTSVGVYLPDPGVIRVYHGLGFLGLFTLLSPLIYMSYVSFGKDGYSLISLLVASSLLFMFKEWWVPGIFGSGGLIEFVFFIIVGSSLNGRASRR